MPDQLAGAALIPHAGGGGEVVQLANLLVHLAHHRHGCGLTVDHQHVHFARFQVFVDHFFAGVGLQQQRQVGLLTRRDLAHLQRGQFARLPMPAAQRHVALVAAQHDLLALARHLAVHHAGVAGGLASAPAHRLDLLDGVRPGHQPGASLKQLAAEVCAQAVADHRDVHPVHDLHQARHLLLLQKLGLVHDDAVVGGEIHIFQLLHVDAGRAQAAAGAHDALAVAIVQPGLHHQRVLTALVVVVLHHDGVRRLGGTHRAVAEVELCHVKCTPFAKIPNIFAARGETSCRTRR